MKKVKTQIFYLLIVFWILLSVFDVFYNFIKSFSEISHWLPLSDAQKRQEVYGKIYNFIIFISQHTKNNSKILIYSKDDKAYFLGRYYLYPRIVNVVSNVEELNKTLKLSNINYLALDNLQEEFVGFVPIASNSSWIIYKRE